MDHNDRKNIVEKHAPNCPESAIKEPQLVLISSHVFTFPFG
jgi:hypothetical protein